METPRTTLDLATSLGKTPAEITAQFAKVPALAPAAELICGCSRSCRAVRNADVYDQASDKANDKAVHNGDITTPIEPVTQCLQQIYAKMNGWTQMNKLQGFLHRIEIFKDIERCHHMLTQCLEPRSIEEITLDWQAQFKLYAERNHRELVDFLVTIQNSEAITNDALQSQGNEIQQIMSMMQQLMRDIVVTANLHHNGLSSNLYDLQLKSRELLPDLHLRAGEITRIGQFPISGTSGMDIYEGLYLGREKVAIKVVRAVNSDENSLRRFKRECEIWKSLWKIDQGQHVLPLLGFCQEDGPFPYIVSPLQVNGTALTYIKNQGDKIDYLKMVKGVARGLQVLHSMDRPVVHGDLKASNIAIGVAGNPLITDFGLSRLNITGIPFSQSRGVSDSYRWFAPEVCLGQGVLSLRSDVYAYGMTVLEILTHEQPYNNIKHTTEVVIRSAKGEHPPRPRDVRVVQRGLDDNVWALLGLCWATEPSQRPTIQEVLNMFPGNPL
ncbi:kinase-like domain-containing protein [Mycena olivaceomarginata]|nr:kinase-like domain-containing protein [Mycena olivaceomarginata]